jgi:hypothetical protein
MKCVVAQFCLNIGVETSLVEDETVDDQKLWKPEYTKNLDYEESKEMTYTSFAPNLSNPLHLLLNA